MGDAHPPSWMLSWSLFHPSRSWFPCAVDEVAVREYVLQMDGFTIDHPAKHFNKNTKTRGKD